MSTVIRTKTNQRRFFLKYYWNIVILCHFRVILCHFKVYKCITLMYCNFVVTVATENLIYNLFLCVLIFCQFCTFSMLYYESWTTLLLNPTLPKDESLWSYVCFSMQIPENMFMSIAAHLWGCFPVFQLI